MSQHTSPARASGSNPPPAVLNHEAGKAVLSDFRPTYPPDGRKTVRELLSEWMDTPGEMPKVSFNALVEFANWADSQ